MYKVLHHSAWCREIAPSGWAIISPRDCFLASFSSSSSFPVHLLNVFIPQLQGSTFPWVFQAPKSHLLPGSFFVLPNCQCLWPGFPAQATMWWEPSRRASRTHTAPPSRSNRAFVHRESDTHLLFLALTIKTASMAPACPSPLLPGQQYMCCLWLHLLSRALEPPCLFSPSPSVRTRGGRQRNPVYLPIRSFTESTSLM